MIKILLSIILICIFTTPHSLIATDKVVNIYSARKEALILPCLLYTSPSPRDLSTSRMPSSA